MVGAASSRVAFLVRDHEAWAHDVVFRLGTIFAAALADSNATQSCMCEAAVVFGILEMRGRFPRMVICTETQILVHAMRIDELAGIHLPIGIPNGFVFAKSLNQLRLEHLVEKFG